MLSGVLSTPRNHPQQPGSENFQDLSNALQLPFIKDDFGLGQLGRVICCGIPRIFRRDKCTPHAIA